VALFSDLRQLFVYLLQNACVIVRAWTLLLLYVSLYEYIRRSCLFHLFFVQQFLAAFVAVVTATVDVVNACLCALTILHAKLDSHVVIDDIYRFVQSGI
jgi:hypothetical protein